MIGRMAGVWVRWFERVALLAATLAAGCAADAGGRGADPSDRAGGRDAAAGDPSPPGAVAPSYGEPSYGEPPYVAVSNYTAPGAAAGYTDAAAVARASGTPVTRADVEGWAARGTSDEIIIDRIEQGGVAAPLTAADESHLRDSRVSEDVIRAIKGAAGK